MRPICFTLLLALLAPVAFAQTDLSVALEKARTDSQTALQELKSLRETIAKERPEIAKEFGEVELELRNKRRLARIARLSQQDHEIEMRQIERDRSVRSQDATYLAGLLKDHALKTETLLAPGEPALDLDPGLLAATLNDPSEALTQRLPILDSAITRLEQLFGGSTAPGDAAGSDGRIVEGTFIAAGPVAYFVAKDSSIAGEVISEKGAKTPRIAPNGSKQLVELAAGKSVPVALDVTGGSAQALQEIDGGFIDLVKKGGLWVWPIMLLAALSLVFGLIKLAQFARLREPGEAWVNAILAALRVGDREKAQTLAREVKHPAGPVMVKLIDVSANSADLVEETLYEQLMGVQDRAGSMLPIIAITAATSPLLGLLGTVSGMIATFNLITLFGSGDPKPLAGGISEALITTLFGLVVAIPALILHAFLSRRSLGIAQTTERLGLSFVNALRAK